MVLLCTLTGWAQIPGSDMGFKRIGPADIKDGMEIGLQSISSTNPYNWFQGEGAALSLSSKAVLVVEATGNYAADGTTPLYRLRQKNAESADVAYLQAPAATAENITMGPLETAVEIEFRPYSEQPTSDGAEYADQVDNDLTSRLTATVNGTVTRLNCNANYADGTNTQPVRWATGMASWSFWNIYEIPSDIRFIPITYNVTFYDGNSDVTLADAGLDNLIPSAAAEGTVTEEGMLGDTITLPTFTNTVIRSAMRGSEVLTDSATFVLTEDILTDGALTVDVKYTSNPQITFICTMDLTAIGGADGEYYFPDGNTTTTRTARFAVGDTLTAPAIANFTALTDLSNEIAATSKEVTVTYRPWRQITANCGFVLSDGTLSSVRNVDIYVDLGDTLTAPELGEMYVFDAEATAERSGVTLPLVVDAGNIYNQMPLELVYTRNVPFKLAELNDNGTLNEETATWYVLRIRGSKVITDQLNETYNGLLLDANATIDDHTLWAIAEAPDGSGAFLLYNKANPGKVLCDMTGGLQPPVLTDIVGGEMGFDLVNITNGYGLRLSAYYNGQENVLMNDVAQNNYLGYWDNTAAWNDPGSTITFEEYNPDNYTFLTGRSYLNAQDCIDGFTADQLADIRGYIEEGDINMESEVDYICNNELRYEENRVEYVDGDVYAIISGASQYIQRNNVKMGLYVREDSVLAWKEFDPTDNRFYFQLTDIETLKDLNGQDSTVFGLYNVGAEGHLWGNFVYGGQVKLAAEYNTATDRYHAVPVEELTNTETGAVTRSYVPAGFYIQRLKPGTWDNPDSAPVIVTFCMHTGAVNANTEGTVTSYNTHQDAYANVFRFYHLGTPEQVGIGSVTADNQEAGDGKLYDLSGRQLQSEPQKGIFIKNGKAVLK